MKTSLISYTQLSIARRLWSGVTHLFLLTLLTSATTFAAETAASADAVALDLFTSPGCTECERVKAEILPNLEECYYGHYTLTQHDLTQAETVPLFLAYQERCHNQDNGLVSLVVDHTVFLSGFEMIDAELFDRIDAAISQRQNPDWRPPAPPALDAATAQEKVFARASALTLSVVIIGGLTDGFNPCAISTLIFFLSLLATLKVDKRTRLLVGIAFIVASFLVYIGLGIGFLEFIRRVPQFTTYKWYFEKLIGLAMIPLALLSFRDAFRFRKSGHAKDVTLQIPKGIKTRMHTIMRRGMGWGGPLLSGALIGGAVTVLESVCTGQGYLPVLTYLAKEGHANPKSWCLLVLYNVFFVAPLTVVFVCFHRGMQINSLVGWSRRNLVVVKIFLGLFFTAIAILLLGVL